MTPLIWMTHTQFQESDNHEPELHFFRANLVLHYRVSTDYPLSSGLAAN